MTGRTGKHTLVMVLGVGGGFKADLTTPLCSFLFAAFTCATPGGQCQHSASGMRLLYLVALGPQNQTPRLSFQGWD